MGLPEDIDRAVVSFFTGDSNLGTSLEAIARALEQANVICAIVRDSGEAVVSEESRHLREPLSRVTVFANGTRLYATAAEGKLANLFEDGAPPGSEWLACEPIPDDPDRRAAVVVVGKRASDEVLVLLPRLAKACAAMMMRDRADSMAWKLTHSLNNLLAGAIANAEYAATLLETIRAGEVPSDEEREDIIHAIENTRDGVKKMVATVKTLTASRRP